MTNHRIISRCIIINDKSTHILLIQNQGSDFWYPPGGGIEDSDISLESCAEREVQEETGLKCKTKRLLFVQELHKHQKALLEFFWLCDPVTMKEPKLEHTDTDENSPVAQVRWFSTAQMSRLKVFPAAVKQINFEQIFNESGVGYFFDS